MTGFSSATKRQKGSTEKTGPLEFGPVSLQLAEALNFDPSSKKLSVVAFLLKEVAKLENLPNAHLAEIAAIRYQHLNDTLELKLKLSEAIDQNYKLFQLQKETK